MKTNLFLLAVSFVLIVIRIWIARTSEPHPLSFQGSYQAAAHCFVSALGVSGYYTGSRFRWGLFWILNAVEVTAALVSRL